VDRPKPQLSRRSSGRCVSSRHGQSSHAVNCQQSRTYLLLISEANLSDSHAPILLEIAPRRVDHSNIVFLVACRHLLSSRPPPLRLVPSFPSRSSPYLLSSWPSSTVHSLPGLLEVWRPIFVHLVVCSIRARSKDCLRGTDYRNSLVSC